MQIAERLKAACPEALLIILKPTVIRIIQRYNILRV